MFGNESGKCIVFLLNEEKLTGFIAYVVSVLVINMTLGFIFFFMNRLYIL